MNKTIQIGWMVLFVFAINQIGFAQVTEDFDVVFGQMADDGDNPPLEGWAGALNSSDFGPTGIFSGCGQHLRFL